MSEPMWLVWRQDPRGPRACLRWEREPDPPGTLRSIRISESDMQGLWRVKGATLLDRLAKLHPFSETPKVAELQITCEAGQPVAWTTLDPMLMDDIRLAAGKLREVTGPGRLQLSDDYELVGLIGEALFALAWGCPWRPRVFPGHNDGGLDFMGWIAKEDEPLQVALDVKGTQRAGHTFVKENKLGRAHLFIWVEVKDVQAGTGRLLGWASRRTVLASQLEPGKGGQHRNHVVTELLPVEALRANLHSVEQYWPPNATPVAYR